MWAEARILEKKMVSNVNNFDIEKDLVLGKIEQC